MKKPSFACVILSAGKGTRMKSRLPKVLHPIAGLPMLGHVLKTCSVLEPDEIIVVTSPELPEVSRTAQALELDATIVEQSPAQGTGHAVQCTAAALEGFKGKVLVLYGDTPLLREETLTAMLQSETAITVLGMRPQDPAAYGRLICDENGALQRIVEFKDANESERAVTLCNSGVMAIDGSQLYGWLNRIDNNNAKGEYYLTDIIALAIADGQGCSVIEADETELLGVNDRTQLAQAELAMQQRLRQKAMEDGVTLIAPETVTFSHDTILHADVVIEPNVFFAQEVEVKSGAVIRAFSHLEGACVESGAIIGPYARLRPGAHVGASAHIGNFVEIKKAEIGTGAKINHLSYVGDASVGEYANIGAGTITCNYDGFQKYRTCIGDYAFIGSNSALVAPVEIGEGAMVGAGSTITEDVEANALSMTRPQQLHRPAWASQFRNKKRN